MEGTHNVSYSIGLLEGYLESLAKEGQLGADVALEHLHNIEKVYNETVARARAADIKLNDIQMNLNGWSKTGV